MCGRISTNSSAPLLLVNAPFAWRGRVPTRMAEPIAGPKPLIRSQPHGELIGGGLVSLDVRQTDSTDRLHWLPSQQLVTTPPDGGILMSNEKQLQNDDRLSAVLADYGVFSGVLTLSPNLPERGSDVARSSLNHELTHAYQLHCTPTGSYVQSQ